MDRMKTFFGYLLMIVICYFGSNVLAYVGINNMYEDIENYQYINTPGIIVTVDEAKATSVNGYIDGTIKNDSNTNIKELYLKIDCYSDKKINMGTKYIKIENLKAKDTVSFNTKFKFSNVSYCSITTVNEI